MHLLFKRYLFGSFAVLVLFSGCTSSRMAESPVADFRRQVDTILGDSALRATVTTMKIVSLKTSEVMYERTPQVLMRPASNMKLLTSATALMRLGTGFAFTTRVAFDGTITDSVLHGNVYFKGSGDPDLSTATIASLVREVQARGIVRIDGDIVGDATYFDGEHWGVGWMWDDEPSSDEMYISALSVNHNCVEVHVTPTDTVGASPRVTITPATQYMTVENTAVTGAPGSANTLEITRKYFERSNIITVKGSIPAGGRRKREVVTVLSPELYFLTLAKEELERVNIIVTGATRLGTMPATVQQVARHDQPIDSMVIYLNKVSDNLSAENSLKTISAEVLGGNGSTQHGVSLVKQTLAGFGIDTTAYLQVDGSGVSHYNLVTSDLYIRLLQGMAKQKNFFDLFYRSLPIAGVDGTLSSRMKKTAAQNNLHAKTGTLSGVTTLAGYVTTADGEMFAFSMMMSSFIGSSEPFRRAQDAIGVLMANFKR